MLHIDNPRKKLKTFFFIFILLNGIDYYLLFTRPDDRLPIILPWGRG